jgi:hypothetical protein
MIVKNILIGEDIRQEVGNKLSLMGILSGSLNLEIPAEAPKDIPALITLAFLVSVENTDMQSNPKDFSVHIMISIGDETKANINARIESSGVDRIIHLPIPRFEFPIINNCTLIVRASVLKGDSVVSESSTVLDINLHRHES